MYIIAVANRTKFDTILTVNVKRLRFFFCLSIACIFLEYHVSVKNGIEPVVVVVDISNLSRMTLLLPLTWIEWLVNLNHNRKYEF